MTDHTDGILDVLPPATNGFRVSAADLARIYAPEDVTPEDLAPGEPVLAELTITPLEQFAAVDEPGAAAILGTDDDALIPEGGDVMFFGDGGAGKTTLALDLIFHLASGRSWLGIHVPRATTSLVVENEGPRAPFRGKVRRKSAAWDGPPLDRRVMVLEHPWGKFTFADQGCRDTLAKAIADNEIDVLLIGPVVASGMSDAGTLQEVRAFTTLGADLRATSGRRLTVIYIHHENKAGTVSGAWEGAVDTLLHVSARGNGFTSLHVAKARWSSTHHGLTFELQWTSGEGFALRGDRDLDAEIVALLADGRWRTAKEIATPAGHPSAPGVGANIDAVKDILAGHPDQFAWRTGDDAKAVGRHPSATVWQVTRAPESPESPPDSLGGVGEGDSGDSPLRESPSSEPPPHLPIVLTQPAESAEPPDDLEARAERLLERHEEAP